MKISDFLKSKKFFITSMVAAIIALALFQFVFELFAPTLLVIFVAVFMVVVVVQVRQFYFLKDLKKYGFTLPSEWAKEDIWSDEKIDSFAKDEDSKIVEWAFGNKDVQEVFGNDGWGHGEEENGFPEEFASCPELEDIDHRRLTLLADLMVNEEVNQVKREKLFSTFYMRLYNSLSAPRKFFFFDPTQELTRQSQQHLLKWCAIYSQTSRHGIIKQYCKDVREMLEKTSKYKKGFSYDHYKGIQYDEWLNSVLWPRRERWFPSKKSDQ